MVQSPDISYLVDLKCASGELYAGGHVRPLACDDVEGRVRMAWWSRGSSKRPRSVTMRAAYLGAAAAILVGVLSLLSNYLDRRDDGRAGDTPSVQIISNDPPAPHSIEARPTVPAVSPPPSRKSHNAVPGSVSGPAFGDVGKIDRSVIATTINAPVTQINGDNEMGE